MTAKDERGLGKGFSGQEREGHILYKVKKNSQRSAEEEREEMRWPVCGRGCGLRTIREQERQVFEVAWGRHSHCVHY